MTSPSPGFDVAANPFGTAAPAADPELFDPFGDLEPAPDAAEAAVVDADRFDPFGDTEPSTEEGRFDPFGDLAAPATPSGPTSVAAAPVPSTAAPTTPTSQSASGSRSLLVSDDVHTTLSALAAETGRDVADLVATAVGLLVTLRNLP